MKSQLGFKLNPFFLYLYFPASEIFQEARRCSLTLLRCIAYLSVCFRHSNSILQHMSHRVNAIVVLMILSVVKKRLLQTSRCWPAAQLSVFWLPRWSFDCGTYSCKTLDTAWFSSSLFHLCTLCGALGISFGFLLKALDVNQWDSSTLPLMGRAK